jgi:mono/diheme cytochrome c family protein
MAVVVLAAIWALRSIEPWSRAEPGDSARLAGRMATDQSGNSDKAIAPSTRGAYLALAGNCAGCHTARGGQPYAGGRRIETPFGSVYTSNLTPDEQTGLGRWSADDFWRALHEGRSRDGRALSPAFPYTSYTRVSREDSDALFAWLRTLPAVAQANQPAALVFPWNLPGLIEVWRWLFFRAEAFAPDPSRDAQWNRGAYLVQGLGHCGECHTARNALGALRGTPLGGADLMPQGWHAPSLLSDKAGSVGVWTPQQAVLWLQSGLNQSAVATGPMARVVIDSLQHLDLDDLQAMQAYLRTLERPSATARTSKPVAIDPGYLKLGSELYSKHCADCHGESGEGAPPHYPVLAGNRTLTQDSSINLIRAVLHGGFAPATRSNPRPYGMPPFGPLLNDREAGALLSYLRTAWGHRAAPIEPRQVNALRGVPVD